MAKKNAISGGMSPGLTPEELTQFRSAKRAKIAEIGRLEFRLIMKDLIQNNPTLSEARRQFIAKYA